MENPASNGCSDPAARRGCEVGVAAVEQPMRVSAKGGKPTLADTLKPMPLRRSQP